MALNNCVKDFIKVQWSMPTVTQRQPWRTKPKLQIYICCRPDLRSRTLYNQCPGYGAYIKYLYMQRHRLWGSSLGTCPTTIEKSLCFQQLLPPFPPYFCCPHPNIFDKSTPVCTCLPRAFFVTVQSIEKKLFVMYIIIE